MALFSSSELTEKNIPTTNEEITLDWLNSIFNQHEIQVKEFSFEEGDAKEGRGYLSSLNRVKMLVVHDNDKDKEPKHMNIVIKSLPPDPHLKDYIVRTGYCQNELQMYTKILPELEKFLDARQVPKENRFNYPICYYGSDQVGKENADYKFILVLEDLIASSFDPWKEGANKSLDWGHTAAAVKQLALFHGATVAYKITQGIKYFLDVYPHLLQPSVDDPALSNYIATGFATTRRLITSDKLTPVNPPETTEGILNRLNELEGQFITFVSNHVLKVDLNELNCIRHSDLHIHNLHFRETDTIEAKWFDFQASMEGRPMGDLGFFLILSCESKFSTTELDETLKFYYEIFMGVLKDAKVELDYPFEKLQKDFKENRLFCILHIISGAPNWVDRPDSNDIPRQRLRDAIVYAYNNGQFSYPMT